MARQTPPDDEREDRALRPDPKRGGIPLGMQAGAKAGSDLVNRRRHAQSDHAQADTSDRGDELNDAAMDDRNGSLTRVSGSEADAIGGSSIGDTGSDPFGDDGTGADRTEQ